jgi:putative endonuclease
VGIDWIRSRIAVLTTPVELPLAPGERRRTAPDAPRARVGHDAEELAARVIRRKGYRILCRNRANRFGELDIVAQDGDTIVFVEVRARGAGSPIGARDTLTRHKRQALARAAELFLRAHDMQGRRCRFDLVAVSHSNTQPAPDVEHIVDAMGDGGRL